MTDTRLKNERQPSRKMNHKVCSINEVVRRFSKRRVENPLASPIITMLCITQLQLMQWVLHFLCCWFLIGATVIACKSGTNSKLNVQQNEWRWNAKLEPQSQSWSWWQEVTQSQSSQLARTKWHKICTDTCNANLTTDNSCIDKWQKHTTRSDD